MLLCAGDAIGSTPASPHTVGDRDAQRRVGWTFAPRVVTLTTPPPPGSSMRIATWNVNSLNIRLPHVLDWLSRNPVDVLALQETKLADDKFPAEALQAAGYRVDFIGQKTYNGVALVSRNTLSTNDVVADIPGFEDDQKRVLSATIDGVRVVCVYVPNGQSVGSDKYAYKLRWMAALQEWLRGELAVHPKLVVLGDFNVAPADEDVHDPKAWEGQVLCSQPERDALKGLVSIGLADSFRLFDQPPKQFTWWDYRMLGFQKGRGLRIDHVLVSATLAKACTACAIDRDERTQTQPSDHAPVIATFDLA
jgi:exodeoxyribonuclease-3